MVTNLLWFMVFVNSIINLLSALSDPLKYSLENACYRLPCRTYSISTSVIFFVIDIILLGILTHTNPIIETLPTYWYLMYGFLGLFVIYLNFSKSEIITPNKRINPPPEIIYSKNVRLALYIVSLTLYVLIFIVRYVTEAQSVIPKQTELEKFFWNRFGGYKPDNITNFVLSYFVLIALPLSIIRVIKGVEYHPGWYNLPLSWRH